MDNQNQNPQENPRVPNNPQAKEFRKTHWTPDKFTQDGQVKAGEPDEEHEKFLETTEFVK